MKPAEGSADSSLEPVVFEDSLEVVTWLMPERKFLRKLDCRLKVYQLTLLFLTSHA